MPMDTRYIGNAVKMYEALVSQLGNRECVPMRANGGRWPNHGRLVVKGNTYINRETYDSVSVTFHGTTILTVNMDGVITLNTGGYHTTTTKRRLNEIARLGQDGYDSVFSVHQKDYNWFVNGDIPFEDGMKLEAGNGYCASCENTQRIDGAVCIHCA